MVFSRGLQAWTRGLAIEFLPDSIAIAS